MAKNNTITPEKKVEYIETDWGELVYGTKAKLQSLGIAVGLAFPGEPDGPKRRLRTIDPRGFKTLVERSSLYGMDGEDDWFLASISFPGRERKKEQWIDFAPGIRKSSEYLWFDEYVGTDDALSAAGLVRQDQFPGQPGMRKVRVTIFADGTTPGGAPTANNRRSREPGTKIIERTSKRHYSVCVVLPKDEEERRQKARERANDEYEAQMRALPRPTPLNGLKGRSHQQATPGVTEYRETVKSAAATCFRMLESYMFNPKETCGLKDIDLAYSPEVRESLLGHKNSIWQELSKLIDQGRTIGHTLDNRPALYLIRNE